MAKERILTVEDDVSMAKLICRSLKSLGYSCLGTVATGEEALKAVAETQPDLVLMDIMLAGEMDGISAATEIDARHDIPIVFLTAHSDQATLDRAKTSRPHGYIIKPFGEGTLRAGIELAIHRHAAERELKRHHERLHATLNGLDDAVIITDASGIVVFMNAMAADYLSWDAEDAEGNPLSELAEFFFTNGSEHPISPVADALTSPTGSRPLRRCMIQSHSGLTEKIELASFTLRGTGDVLLGVALVFRLLGTGVLTDFEDRVENVYGEVFSSVKSLGGAVSVCAWCKKIKDETGSWIPAEAFVLKYASRWVTHGICPGCESRIADEKSS